MRWRRELGVGDDDRLDARGDRRVDDGEDLVARRDARWRARARGARRRRAPSAARAAARRRRRRTGTGAGVDARRAQLELEAHPHRHVAVGVGVARPRRTRSSELTVGSQTIRAPWRAATSTAVALSPPTAWLSMIVPSASTPGTAALTTAARSAVAGVVRLQPEAGQPELEAALGQLEVGDPARGEVRRDVDVGVEPAAHELPRAFGGDRVIRHWTSIINTIVDNLR